MLQGTIQIRMAGLLFAFVLFFVRVISLTYVCVGTEIPGVDLLDVPKNVGIYLRKKLFIRSLKNSCFEKCILDSVLIRENTSQKKPYSGMFYTLISQNFRETLVTKSFLRDVSGDYDK